MWILLADVDKNWSWSTSPTLSVRPRSMFGTKSYLRRNYTSLCWQLPREGNCFNTLNDDSAWYILESKRLLGLQMKSWIDTVMTWVWAPRHSDWQAGGSGWTPQLQHHLCPPSSTATSVVKGLPKYISAQRLSDVLQIYLNGPILKVPSGHGRS